MAVIIVLVVVMITFKKDTPEIIEIKKLTIDDIKYLSYSIENEEFVKDNCAAIRVNRCDVLGEEYKGTECWFNNINFKYEISGMLQDGVKCQASSRDIPLGIRNYDNGITIEYEQSFSKVEGDTNTLTFQTDIRKGEAVSICCEFDGKSSCFSPVQVNSIC